MLAGRAAPNKAYGSWTPVHRRQPQPPADREQLQTVALDHPAPDAERRLQHDGDGENAQQDQIVGAVVGQQFAQQDVDQHADERAFDGADAADHHHKDHHHGPVVDAEAGLGRKPQLLQEDQAADQAGAGRR